MFSRPRWRIFLLQLSSLQVWGFQTRLAAWLSHGNYFRAGWKHVWRTSGLEICSSPSSIESLDDFKSRDIASPRVPSGQPSRAPQLHLSTPQSVMCLHSLNGGVY